MQDKVLRGERNERHCPFEPQFRICTEIVASTLANFTHLLPKWVSLLGTLRAAKLTGFFVVLSGFFGAAVGTDMKTD